MKSFDKKFGADFMETIPTSAGVYRVYDKDDFLIYIGKAKNLRRRLGQYRNAKRRKAHFKMRKIVAEGVRIEFENCVSDLEACLLEAKLIQEHRPRWNTAGAFFFLYPLIGVKWSDGGTYFCYTTQPEAFEGFVFHGAYRSRGITASAFWALMDLLNFVGHRMPKDRKLTIPKYSHIVGFRQMPEEWMPQWHEFLKGDSKAAMENLILALVENAGARRSGKKIQQSLNRLKLFWAYEAMALKRVREAMGYAVYPVPQKERDFLFLKRRFERAEARASKKIPGPGPAAIR